MILKYIPKKYFHERGVRVEDENVILCSDLIYAMKRGEYSYWKWDREKQPVEVKNCGKIFWKILWFYDNDEEKWYGWKCYANYGGTPVFWLVENPEKPDFEAEEPKNSWEFYKDPAFTNVSITDYIGFLTYLFWADGKIESPESFARIVSLRPFESYYGGASFGAIPTPANKWGWIYETISGRKLIWVPEGIVYTQGLRESQILRGEIEENFGKAEEIDPPGWLDSAIKLAIFVNRPYIREYGEEPIEPDNKEFFDAIKNPPLDYYRKNLTPPTEPRKSYEELWIAFKKLQEK